MSFLSRTAAGFGLCLALGLSGPVAANSGQCITVEEATDVISFVMPDVLRMVGEVCGPMLDSTSFIALGGAERMAERAGPLSDQVWPRAKLVVEREMGFSLPEAEQDAMLSIMRLTMRAGLSDVMDGSTCYMADRFLAQMEPLPAENISNLTALLIELGSEQGGSNDLNLCPVKPKIAAR